MRHRRSQRGAALLLVLTTVAILTAVAVDLAYQTRVSLQIAANSRDELRAASLAKSAVAFSRLVLHFQQQLDQASGGLGAAIAQVPGASALLGGAAGAAAGKAPGAAQAPQFSFRLWDLVPIDSNAASMFLSGGFARRQEERAPPPAQARGGEAFFPEGLGPRAFGEYEGHFEAKIEDEERKINVPQLAGLSTVAGPQLLRLVQLVRDPRFDALFDREDATGNRYTRSDVVVALKDWVDEDEVTSVLTSNPAVPFEAGIGDENFAYDRGPDRYKAKNARFESLDELYLVAGVGDAFMAAFGDQLTVYPDVNAQTNINTQDPQAMLVNILAMSDPPGVAQPAVLDPAFPARLDAALKLARPLPFLSLTVPQFAAVLQALGVRVQPLFLQSTNADARNPFGSKSSTFRIRAVGRVGEVEKTIEAVVTMDARAGALAQDMGRLLHWHEE
jgi:general secretion pathway protein K